MVMIGMTDPIGAITMIIGDLIGQLWGERQIMIDWGVGTVYTTGSAIVLHIFPKTKKSSRRWLMHEFLMSSYSAGTPILIGWSQENIVVHRQGSHHFPHGVQRD